MRIIVIGGGPSGMMAAAQAGYTGHNVTLIESQEKLGKKLYITGKGRCNVTNDCTRDFLLSNIVNNSKFMMSAFYKWDSQSSMTFYECLGVPLKVERGNRVFPASDKSNDIIKAHIQDMNYAGVDIRLNTQILDIYKRENEFVLKLENKKELTCDKLIIATGGKSYASTGSTGDGYKFMKKFGHTIIEPKPALVGIQTNDDLDLAGLSLRNVEVSVLNSNNKKIASEFGEMLFTHNGVSGPTVLSLSSKICRNELKGFKISIDFKPALDNDKLDKRILRDWNDLMNKNLGNSLDKLLPKKIIPYVIFKADIDPRQKVNQIDKESRMRLINTIKNFTLDIDSLGDFNQAIITSGGVNTKEINPKTMESKKCEGLYCVGELLDLDALTGGYNIQIALTTGWIAGNSI